MLWESTVKCPIESWHDKLGAANSQSLDLFARLCWLRTNSDTKGLCP